MVVGLGRLELPTSRLSSARSNQLSYRPQTLFNQGSDKVKIRPSQSSIEYRLKAIPPDLNPVFFILGRDAKTAAIENGPRVCEGKFKFHGYSIELPQ